MDFFDMEIETKRIQDLLTNVNTAIVHILSTLPKNDSITKEMVNEYIKNCINSNIVPNLPKSLIIE
jgi:hypothetical protein